MQWAAVNTQVGPTREPPQINWPDLYRPTWKASTTSSVNLTLLYAHVNTVKANSKTYWSEERGAGFNYDILPFRFWQEAIIL